MSRPKTEPRRIINVLIKTIFEKHPGWNNHQVLTVVKEAFPDSKCSSYMIGRYRDKFGFSIADNQISTLRDMFLKVFPGINPDDKPLGTNMSRIDAFTAMVVDNFIEFYQVPNERKHWTGEKYGLGVVYMCSSREALSVSADGKNWEIMRLLRPWVVPNQNKMNGRPNGTTEMIKGTAFKKKGYKKP